MNSLEGTAELAQLGCSGKTAEVSGVLPLRMLGFSFWTLVLLSRSWTGSKARCCPTQATTLCGTILEIGLTYMVNEAVCMTQWNIHSTKVVLCQALSRTVSHGE